MFNDRLTEKLFSYLSIFVLLLVIGRLIHLQIIENDTYTRLVESQINANMSVTKNRGYIYDRYGEVLAQNRIMGSLYVYKKDIDNSREFAGKLMKNGVYVSGKLSNQLANSDGFIWLSRHMELAKAEKIKQNLGNVGYYREEARYYPQGSLISNVLGFTGIDNQGREGLEYKLDKTLLGDKVLLASINDSRGKSILFENKSDIITPDSAVYLTVSSKIQAIAEHILREGARKYGAKDGAAVAINVHTGEVIFAANVVEFDPHNYSKSTRGAYKNQPFSYLYEPGSIFKTVAFSYLYEHNLIDHNRLYDTSKEIRIGGFSYRDTKNYGILKPADIFVHSSNIGLVKMMANVNNESYYKYLKNAGFGSKTGVYGIKEEGGILKNYKNWSKTSRSSMSIGYEIMVTPIQVVRFYAAIANSGVMLTPKIISKVTKDGVTMVVDNEDKQVMSERTAKYVLSLMQKTVEAGTGRNADTKLVKVAGKTGTAKKYDPIKKEYSNTEYSASFAGVFPADDPKIAMVVIYEAPSSSIYGGSTAANVFKDLAEYISVEMRLIKPLSKVAYAN